MLLTSTLFTGFVGLIQLFQTVYFSITFLNLTEMFLICTLDPKFADLFASVSPFF